MIVLTVLLILIAALSFVPSKQVSQVFIIAFSGIGVIKLQASFGMDIAVLAMTFLFIILSVVNLMMLSYLPVESDSPTRPKSMPLQAITILGVLVITGAILMIVENEKGVLLTLEQESLISTNTSTNIIDQFQHLSHFTIFLIIGLAILAGIKWIGIREYTDD